MKTARIHVIGLISIAILAFLMSSCGPVKQADALMSKDGTVSGIVVEYRSPVDNESVTQDTYQISGKKVRSIFLSNSNPFKKDPGVKGAAEGGGRYVVILLKAGNNGPAPDKPVEITPGKKVPLPDVRVKQVSQVQTTSGKVIKPWKKAIKATDYYLSKPL
ncbi:MAG: hypothetical protein IJ840_01625 [Bacteroidales bacterium]|nr:hypothetical protein [Bacteroidales bacterium]